MYRYLLVILTVLLMVLTACSGEEAVGIDKTPPTAPVLYRHLGNTGDGWVMNQNQTDSLLIDDQNNGIDAVPTGNKIRIHWDHMLDKDLKLIRIFRFALGNQPVKIDSLAPNNEEYEDELTNIGDMPALETLWHYYIQSVDHSGNYSTSDTVSYRLIEKTALIDPVDNANLMNSNITFKWYKLRDVEKFRLIIFNDFQEYVWHRDLDVALEDNIIELNYNGQNSLPSGTYYWRIDAFRDRIDGGTLFYSGSESQERKFVIE